MLQKQLHTATESETKMKITARGYMYRPLTTLWIAPGLWTRRALTTWKTSTTPSVLHLSMVVAMAQNIPDLLTVSLQTHTHTQYMSYSYSQLKNLQWIKMGLLLVRICTLMTSSMTSVTVLMFEMLPSGAQLVMWN